MEVKIYLIEDINDLRYVGSTKKKINRRLSEHKYDKKLNKYCCSSSKLNLDNCIITELETCNEANRKQREQYWMDKIDCVNCYKSFRDKKQYDKEYHQNNKEYLKEYNKIYRQNNKDKIKEYLENNKDKIKEQKKIYYQNNKEKIKEYHQNNKDKCKEYNKIYHENNKDKIKEQKKIYHENNKDKIRQYNKERWWFSKYNSAIADFLNHISTY
jgi:hypothetical protein